MCLENNADCLSPAPKLMVGEIGHKKAGLGLWNGKPGQGALLTVISHTDSVPGLLGFLGNCSRVYFL